MKKHTSKNLLYEDDFSLDAPLKIDIGTFDSVKSNKGRVNASGSSTASAGVASIKINVSKGSKEKGDEKDI